MNTLKKFKDRYGPWNFDFIRLKNAQHFRESHKISMFNISQFSQYNPSEVNLDKEWIRNLSVREFP